jgi:hypothetical protein
METSLSHEQRRYLADELLRAWQEGMRQAPMQWEEFESRATHVGLHLLSLANSATDATEASDG